MSNITGGWEAQGGPLHPPDFDRGWRHPPGPPLKPPLHQRVFFGTLETLAFFKLHIIWTPCRFLL